MNYPVILLSVKINGMKFFAARAKLPSFTNSLLAILSAVLLVLAFPGFEIWFAACFALVPLFYAVERERESFIKSFVLGWIFGTCFFFGSCWWLTFSLINYAAIPAPVAYFLLFLACLIVGLLPAIFSVLFSLLLKRFGTLAILLAPFLWTAIEFFRFWVTGNNWNAIGYSQAFRINTIKFASTGGIYLVGFLLVLSNAIFLIWLLNLKKYFLLFFAVIFFLLVSDLLSVQFNDDDSRFLSSKSASTIVAIQPNVPMSGLKYEDLIKLRERHVELAGNVLQKLNEQHIIGNEEPTIVIFPESPMNFEYERDREFQQFLSGFATKNNVSVLFNAAEPTVGGSGLYNSAVLVDKHGAKVAQYDKIHLVPFGEYVPLPGTLAQFVPTMVGNFEIGKSYDLIPFGDAQAGIMICFESHFPNLSRAHALNGADVLVELTNDGYLGNTPVLRQHLANAVFRAVETNRPLLRVTNVGITAYIDENGRISDETRPFTEDTRVWTVKKSGAPQTFYVKYGDWFAWLCSLFSLALLAWSFRKKVSPESYKQEN